jgi:hypothetical protein
MRRKSRLSLTVLVLIAGGLSPPARGGPAFQFVLEQVQEISSTDYLYYYGMTFTSQITITYGAPANLVIHNAECPPIAVVSTPAGWSGGIFDPGIVNFVYHPVPVGAIPGPQVDYGPFVVEFHCPDSGGGNGPPLLASWNIAVDVAGFGLETLSGNVIDRSVPEPSTLLLSGASVVSLLVYVLTRRVWRARTVPVEGH